MRLARSKIIVTHHAIQRYQDRCKAGATYDDLIGAVRRCRLVSPAELFAIMPAGYFKSYGGCCFATDDGSTAFVLSGRGPKEFVVVTVLSAGMFAERGAA